MDGKNTYPKTGLETKDERRNMQNEIANALLETREDWQLEGRVQFELVARGLASPTFTPADLEKERQRAKRKGCKFNPLSWGDGTWWVKDLKETSYRAPNVLLPAKDTYLAARLRRGQIMPIDALQILRHTRRERPFPRLPLTPFRLDALRGKLIGLEIEYYPHDDVTPSENVLTRIVSDGSLDEYGKEIKRVTWVNNGRLKGLDSLLLQGTVNRKCGLHVHIDVRHLSEHSAKQAYRRIVECYPYLKNLVPASRLENRYCRFIDNSGRVTSRYAAVNWQSYREHKTLEFRCLNGTLNKKRIAFWARFCQALVTIVSEPTWAAPATWPLFLNRFPSDIAAWAEGRAEVFAPIGQVARFETLTAEGE